MGRPLPGKRQNREGDCKFPAFIYHDATVKDKPAA